MTAAARITGRVRAQDKAPGTKYRVEFYVGRMKVGFSETSSDGSFEMGLPSATRIRSGAPFVSIRLLSQKGDVVLKTVPTSLTGGVLNFQVMLGNDLEGRRESDIYANNLRRLLVAYRKLEGRLDPSNEEAMDGLKGLVNLIARWTEDRKRVESAGASEVVQVPKHPKVDKHRHVSAWDEVVLRA